MTCMRGVLPVLLLALTATARSQTLGTGPHNKLALGFEANQGQTDARVKFLARLPGYTLFVTPDEAVLTARDGTVERMKLMGVSRKMRMEPLDKQPGISSYLIGNDSSKWLTNIPNYRRVALREVYPGIDLVFYGNQRKLEYDWVLAPGADPKQIRVKWEGTGEITGNASGDLVLSARLVQKKPVIRQAGREIEGRYVVRGREVMFEVAKYDAAKTLVIDPVLVYSTYLGGTGNDNGAGIAVDTAGNAYITGHTDSKDFPTVNPFQKTNPEGGSPGVGDGCVFVSKISADGSKLLYSTYLGGNGYDVGNAIAVDSAGDAFVTGSTTSSNFPMANAIQDKNLAPFGTAFVTKLSPAGNALLFSTYLGGSQSDVGYGITVDSAGNAYITGNTNSQNFPVVNPIETPPATGSSQPTGFVTKMSGNGSALIYSTYLGGANGEDIGYGIAVDSTGSAYVAGTTASTDLPLVNALQSTNKNTSNTGFVVKINPSGSAFAYSTYLGGSQIDYLYAIAVDSSGNAYVTGRTNSKDFPTVNALETSGAPTAVVSKINATGSALVYSTYLGSAGAVGYGIAVNAAGEAWVTGTMSPAHFPMVNPVINLGNDNGVFATQFSADGTKLLFSSPLFTPGLSSQGGITLDAAGNAYVTGAVSPNDTATATGFQPSFGGGEDDAMVMKILAGPAVPNIAANGVVNGASFQPGIVPGSWATINGSNLSAVTDTWDKFIVDGKLPTKVDGVSVSVGGTAAYVYYISPGQINFIVPDVGEGAHQVVVTNSAGTSAAVSVTAKTFGPAFFLWPNSQAVATYQNFTLAAASGTFAGATTVPAKPGDLVILWGTGFGPTTPAAPVGEGTPSDATYSTSTAPTVTLDDMPAKVLGAALAPGFAGLYQVAIQVPSSIGNGNWPVVATIGGVSSPAGAVLTVQQ
jgi:uncharacterized protein (TIGR03437 family)